LIAGADIEFCPLLSGSDSQRSNRAVSGAGPSGVGDDFIFQGQACRCPISEIGGFHAVGKYPSVGVSVMQMPPVIQRLVRPLASRKVRVALVTVVAAFGVEWGWNVQEELILTILGAGVALILGIAHEDAGRNAGGTGNGPASPTQSPPH
jgi:hypothetical protein